MSLECQRAAKYLYNTEALACLIKELNAVGEVIPMPRRDSRALGFTAMRIKYVSGKVNLV